MATPTICGTCDTGCPIPPSQANGLGFLGHACCRAPCPTYPLSRVSICYTVNQLSQFTFEVGCADPLVGEQTCPDLHYQFPSIQDSWGRRARSGVFIQDVQRGAYIRVRVCAASTLCTGACPNFALPQYVPNAITSFSINEQDFLSVIVGVANTDGTTDCIHAWCTDGVVTGDAFDPTSYCCQYINDDGLNVYWDARTEDDNTASNLPWGTEIVFGPVGSVLL